MQLYKYRVYILKCYNSTASGFPISDKFLRWTNETSVLMTRPRSDNRLLLRSSDTRLDLTTHTWALVVI